MVVRRQTCLLLLSWYQARAEASREMRRGLLTVPWRRELMAPSRPRVLPVTGPEQQPEVGASRALVATRFALTIGPARPPQRGAGRRSMRLPGEHDEEQPVDGSAAPFDSNALPLPRFDGQLHSEAARGR